jgi:hypothetical protein
MSTLTIRKKSLKTWLHTDSVLGNFIISKFYFNADNVSFQIVEQGQSKRVIYNITDITLYALPTGGTAETFGNITELSLRLEELNYPAFQYDGQITSIANLIDAGTGVTITGDGTAESPYIINSTAAVPQLVALPFTTDHLTATGNQYTVGNVVFYNGNVYRCIAANDSILPTNTLYWTNLGAGYPLVQEPADWNSTSGNNQILNKPTIQSNQTLAEVLAEGNTTEGEDISISDGDKIVLDNGANLKKGTTDAGLGGSKGIALRCAVDYELKWEAGRLYVMGGDGFTIREVSHNFTNTPTVNDDNTKGFVVDSRWILDNGEVYLCTDDTTGDAVWEMVSQIPTLQNVLDFNHALVSGRNYQGTSAGLGAIGNNINAFGTNAALFNTGDNVNALGNTSGNNNSGDNVNAFGDSAGNGNTFNNVNLLGLNATANEDGQTVLSKDGIIMACIGTIDLTDTRKYSLPDADGTIALTSDIPSYTTPTLQEVLDEGDAAVDSAIFLSNTANDFETSFNEFGDGKIAVKSIVNDTLTEIGAGQVYLGNISGDGIIINSEKIFNPSSLNEYAFPTGTSSPLATLADITTPTLQDVTDEGNTTNNSIIINGNNELSVNYGNNLSAVYSSSILSANNSTGSYATLSSDGNVGLGNASNYQTSIAANNLTNNAVQFELPNKTIGTYTLATTSDIPTGGGGIPHATAAGTDTYTATITGVTAYNDADAFLIRFTNGNTTSATLNINGLGARALYRNNDGVLIGGDIISGGEMLCVYNSTNNRFQVIGTAPNSLFSYVTNADSVTLTKGMPVYAFGGTGDRMTVKRAFNTSDATSAQTVGLVLSTSIGVNQKGLIMMQGLLDGLSILPTSTWNDGDPVYLGATAGTITNVKPYAPNHLVYLGVVTTASNGSAGRMYVRIQNGFEIQELHNVQAQSPTLNDTLYYDDTVSPAQWKTASIPTILGYTPPNLGLVQAVTFGLQNIF